MGHDRRRARHGRIGGVGNLTATRPPQPWTAPTASDPVSASLRLPGSKSMTNRALVLSALATGPSTLAKPLRARDTELMAAGLRAMGAHVSIADDERWLLRPHRLVGPAHVDVGLAGTIMRFVPPVAGLADGAGHLRRRSGRPHPAARAADRGAALARGAHRHHRSRQPAAGGPGHRPGHRRRGGDRRLRLQPARLGAAAGRAALRPGPGGPARRPARALRAPPADDRADAARRRRGGRRQHARRLGGRAGSADRARLGDRAGPLRRGAVLRRRPGHRR